MNDLVAFDAGVIMLAVAPRTQNGPFWQEKRFPLIASNADPVSIGRQFVFGIEPEFQRDVESADILEVEGIFVDGKLAAIAVSSSQRSKALPNVP